MSGLIGCYRITWLTLLVSLVGLAFAQPWQRATDGRFWVETASPADAARLEQVFEILDEAAKDLERDWGLRLPEAVTVRVHPTLESFTGETGAPWFVAALADKRSALLHTQRLRVLLERRSLEATLRHELFHLAQPGDWPRWRAEGAALHFADERLQAQPLTNLSDAQLDALLASPPSPEVLARAVATAYARVQTCCKLAPDRSSSTEALD